MQRVTKLVARLVALSPFLATIVVIASPTAYAFDFGSVKDAVLDAAGMADLATVQKGAVLEINTDDEFYKHAVKANRKLFVEFYSPSCSHCRQLAPTWDALAKRMNGVEESGVTIAKVDCTKKANFKTCVKFEILQYPTLHLIHNEGATSAEFTGERSAEALAEFANLSIEDALKVKEVELKDIDEQRREILEEEYKRREGSSLVWLNSRNWKKQVKQKPHFVQFYAPWCGHCKTFAPTWESLGQKFNNDSGVVIAKVDCVEDAAICRKFNIKSFPALKVLTARKPAPYLGQQTEEALSKFASDLAQDPKQAVRVMLDKERAKEKKENEEREMIEQERASSKIRFLTDANFEDAVNERPHLVKFFAPWCGHCKALAPVWRNAADKHNTASGTTTLFAKVDCTQPESRDVCSKYGVTSYPDIKLISGSESLAYPGATRGEDELLSYASLSFAEAQEKAQSAAKADRARKLKQIEADHELRKGSNIQWLTDDDFNSFVAERATLVMFYAPWCGHCKATHPIWEELAEEFKDDEDTPAVAKVECTVEGVHTCERFDVDGYPTIKLVHGDQVAAFEQQRTKNELISFAVDGFESSTLYEEE